MKTLIKTTAIVAALCCGLVACKKSGGDGEPKPKPEPPASTITLTPIEELNQGASAVNSHADVTSRSSLKMNFRSYSEQGKAALGLDKPFYSRIKQLANGGGYVMFYNSNGQAGLGAECNYALSEDLNVWSAKGKLFVSRSITDKNGAANERRYANCDGLVLSNGTVLAVASFRANNGYKTLPYDDGLAIRRSSDNGISWTPEQDIYRGVNWEPYLLEVAPGKVHCYFTDSNRTAIEGTDTGTAMLVSNDYGATWSPALSNYSAPSLNEPYYVIRTKYTNTGRDRFNNQMPSVIKLNGGNKLAAAAEANVNSNGLYYISLAYSDNDGNWDALTVTQEGPQDRQDRLFEGSAPYLVQFPSGETVLSYNKSSNFNLKMGDAQARIFGEPYAPFPKAAYWGSLERIDGHQVIGTIPNNASSAIMIGKMVLNHRIEAIRRNVVVDGDNSEWANTDHALFVGEKSQAQATLRCSADDQNVYFLVEVLDKNMMANAYAAIYLSPVTQNDALGNEAMRIKVGYDGFRGCDVYESRWKEADKGITVSAAYDGTVYDFSDQDYGYLAEVSVPRSQINIRSGEILVNFAIFDSQGGADAVCDTSVPSTSKWIPVVGL